MHLVRPDRGQMAAILITLVALTLPAIQPLSATATARDQQRKQWRNISLPFQSIVKIPAGTTLVRLSAKVAPGQNVTLGATHVESTRRRCYFTSARAWNAPLPGERSCLALAAIDPPGTEWKIDVSSPSASQAQEISVDFLKVPLQGPVARLDLSQLSMPDYKIGETEDLMIESFDGTQLHAQLTRPKTNQKVPTIIVSSPYYGGGGTYQLDVVSDWGPRGYAILIADVRGFNRSQGCVEVWGPNEQGDQKALVEWVADQPWSDGNVGMYGQSYVGTTPVEAAVQAPKALKAIVTIAPVISAYTDWHFGGVPNGENLGSPVAYQALTGATFTPGVEDPLTSAINFANGLCDPTLVARANDPRAIYDNFYRERDFGARAKKVDAAVLYTHGFEDTNVKSAVGMPFFNDLKAPHLGLFGHWVHQHPPRADTEVLFLGWMDQYVKGKDLGFERLPNALVVNSAAEQHELDGWPSSSTNAIKLHPHFAAGELSDKPVDEDGRVLIEPTGATNTMSEGLIRLETELKQPLELAGAATLELSAELAGSGNGHVAAFLFDETAQERLLVSFGMANLAHRKGHESYEPVLPGDIVKMDLTFMLTDHVFERGHKLVLEIRGAQATDWGLPPGPGQPGVLTLHGGSDGTRLLLPTLPAGSAERNLFVDWR